MGGPGWVSVRCLFKTTWAEGSSYEERITLWLTDDPDHAIELAEAEARQYAGGLTSPGTRTDYLGLAQAFALFDEPGQSQEVFSLIRDSDLSTQDYLRTHFDTGRERTSAWSEPQPQPQPHDVSGTGTTDVSSSASSPWSLDRTSSQEEIHQLVSSLRPPAPAYRGGRPVPLDLPLSSAVRFVDEQVVRDLLGAVPGPIDVLPAGSRWHYALDTDQPLARTSGGDGLPARVHLYGTPPGLDVEDLVVGQVLGHGGAQITVDFDAGPDRLRLGPHYDAARGDSLGVLVNGQPTEVAVVEPAVTVLRSAVRVGGRSALLGMTSQASPAGVLTSLLWTAGLS